MFATQSSYQGRQDNPLRVIKIIEGCPARCVFVIDISESMQARIGDKTRLKCACDAAISFCQKKIGRARIEIAVVTYSDTAEVRLPLTLLGKDLSNLTSVLDRLTAEWTTNITDGLHLAFNLLFPVATTVSRNRHQANYIICLTDGHHNTGPSPEKIGDQIKASNITLASVGIGIDPSEVDEVILKKISSLHEGKSLYRFVRSQDELISHYRQLAEWF